MENQLTFNDRLDVLLLAANEVETLTAAKPQEPGARVPEPSSNYHDARPEGDATSNVRDIHQPVLPYQQPDVITLRESGLDGEGPKACYHTSSDVPDVRLHTTAETLV